MPVSTTGSAVAEAVLMCLNAVPRGGKVIVPNTVHPEYREVLATYLKHMQATLIVLDADTGPSTRPICNDSSQRRNLLRGDPAAQLPGPIGVVGGAAEVTHAAGAQLIVSCDPISWGC